MRRLVILSALALAITACSQAPIIEPGSVYRVSGTWAVELQPEGGSYAPAGTMKLAQDRSNGVWSGAFTGTLTDSQGRTFAVSGDAGAGNIGWNTPEGTYAVGGEFAIDNSGSYKGSYLVMTGNPVTTSGSIRMIRTGP